MRRVKPRISPIFEGEDRWCQNDWKIAFCGAALMGFGDVLGCGGLGVAVRTVLSVDEVTGRVCWEVEVKIDVGDIFIGSRLRVDI